MWMVAVMLINLSEWIVYAMIAIDMRRCVGVGAKSLLKFQEVNNDCLIKVHQMMTVLLKYIYC